MNSSPSFPIALRTVTPAGPLPSGYVGVGGSVARCRGCQCAHGAGCAGGGPSPPAVLAWLAVVVVRRCATSDGPSVRSAEGTGSLLEVRGRERQRLTSL